MSLFQCDKCGCVENTACCHYWINKYYLKKKEILCSACDPKINKWHDKFPRVFLEKDKWKTNKDGNLEHIETGKVDYSNYAIEKPK